MDNIARKTKAAVIWRLAGRGAGVTIELGTNIVLARLLMPEDFGIVALALIIIGFARNLSEFGLGAAIVQRQQVEQRHLTAAFWGSAAVGVFMAGALWLVADPAASFFREADVKPVMQLLSITMIVASLTAVPGALLRRALDFRKLFWTDLAGRLAYGAIGIPMAIMGFHFWSLAWASLGGEAFGLIVLVVATRYLPSLRFRLSGLSDLVHFGGGITAVAILNYMAGNVDYFVIGRWLNPAALGLYKKAFNMTMYLTANVSAPLYLVLFPAFSRLQSDPSRVKYAFARALTGITAVTFPLITGIAITAPGVIPAVLGAQWEEAVLPAQILCAAAMFGPLRITAGALVEGMGYVMAAVWRQLLHLVVIGVGCLVAVPWGINAVAVVPVLGSAVLALTMAQYVYKLTGFGLTDYLRALRVPSLGCAVLAAVAFFTLKLLPIWMGSGAALLSTIGASGLAYALAVRFLPFSDVRDIIRDFAELVSSKLHSGTDERPVSVEVGSSE